MSADLDSVRQGRLNTRYTIREVIGSLAGRVCLPNAHDPRCCVYCAGRVLAEEVQGLAGGEHELARYRRLRAAALKVIERNAHEGGCENYHGTTCKEAGRQRDGDGWATWSQSGCVGGSEHVRHLATPAPTEGGAG